MSKPGSDKKDDDEKKIQAPIAPQEPAKKKDEIKLEPPREPSSIDLKKFASENKDASIEKINDNFKKLVEGKKAYNKDSEVENKDGTKTITWSNPDNKDQKVIYTVDKDNKIQDIKTNSKDVKAIIPPHIDKEGKLAIANVSDGGVKSEVIKEANQVKNELKLAEKKEEKAPEKNKIPDIRQQTAKSEPDAKKSVRFDEEVQVAKITEDGNVKRLNEKENLKGKEEDVKTSTRVNQQNVEDKPPVRRLPGRNTTLSPEAQAELMKLRLEKKGQNASPTTSAPSAISQQKIEEKQANKGPGK